MKLPKAAPFYMIFIRDVEHKVTFDFDTGESQWFDGKAGVGSPGYPAYVEIAEIDPPIELTEAEADAVKQEIMDRIDAAAQEYWEGYAEAFQSRVYCDEK